MFHKNLVRIGFIFLVSWNAYGERPLPTMTPTPDPTPTPTPTETPDPEIFANVEIPTRTCKRVGNDYSVNTAGTYSCPTGTDTKVIQVFLSASSNCDNAIANPAFPDLADGKWSKDWTVSEYPAYVCADLVCKNGPDLMGLDHVTEIITCE